MEEQEPRARSRIMASCAPKNSTLGGVEMLLFEQLGSFSIMEDILVLMFMQVGNGG